MTTATGSVYQSSGSLPSNPGWVADGSFRTNPLELKAGALAAQLMDSPYAVFYHEHVLDKEPGDEAGRQGEE